MGAVSASPGLTAEQYAANLIRRALDSAVVPDLPRIADESALTLREVEGIRDRILSGKRGTQDLGRPRAPLAAIPAPAAPSRPAGPAQTDDEQLIANGINHKSAKVRRVAKKCHDASVRLGLLLDELRAALVDADESAAEAARRAKRIAKLEAELAELRGNPKRPVRPVRERQQTFPRTVCPACGKGFAGAQGVSLHQRRTGCGAS